MLHPPQVPVTLEDGTPLIVRLGTPEDGQELLVGFDQLSFESRYRRFFTAKPRLTEAMFKRLTDVDEEHHVAIAAFDPARPSSTGNPDGAGVGVIRVIREVDDPERAEFAVTVIDDYQRRGIGTLLLQAAISVARRIGVKKLVASVLAENVPMLSLATDQGGIPVADPDDPSVRHFEFDIDEAEAGLPPHRRTAFAGLLADDE